MNKIDFRIECDRSHIIIIVESYKLFKELFRIIESNNRKHKISY